MLKSLVKKFKSYSLNEEGQDQQADNAASEARGLDEDSAMLNTGLRVCCQRQETDAILHQNHDHRLRRHCCHHKHTCSCIHRKSKMVETYDKDSGTESDEELELIETNSTHSVPLSQTSDYYASQQSLSINSCRSSHCGSPLLGLSDQECNSWESIGSESGMNLRAETRYHQQRHASFNFNNVFNYEYLLNPSQKNNPSTMITEELPNHHYHTRQQFQRLKQQISMKNGLVSTDFIQQDDAAKSTTPFAYTTAFSPFSRIESTFLPPAAPEKSPGGSSSVDELEEINNKRKSQNQDQLSNYRRIRSSTLSTTSIISSSGVSTWSSCSSTSSSTTSSNNGLAKGSLSEKRKWSQMRQQSRRQKPPGSESCCCCCQCCGGKNAATITQSSPGTQPKTVLHAARKTPVKLLYSLNDGDMNQQEDFVVPNVDTSKNRMDHSKSTRQSARKKCRSEDEGKSVDADDDEKMDESSNTTFVKRPSLDFNKMRAKRVGQSGNKNSRRSKSFNGAFLKSKLKSDQRNGYHLRSTGRQSCLFRPLDPPLIGTSYATGCSTNVDRQPTGLSTNSFSFPTASQNAMFFE